MTILPDLADLVVEQVNISTEVTVTVRATSPTAPCPCCGTSSKRVQSWYTRTLRDLPASGRPVHLIVRVRRFCCQQSACGRNIFAERFPSLTLPRVHFTLRLQEALRQLGFTSGGEAGARLGRKLSLPASPDTILRLVKQTVLPTASSPRVVGVDDWSWKRRLRYGTLICDLESHTPIDLLPDREVTTVSAWFQHHPSVEIVSRDRSAEYAAAISKGAPQALQVADRWHLGKNLADSISALLARCRADMRQRFQTSRDPAAVPPSELRPYRSRREHQAHYARRMQRLDRYAQVVALQHQGLTAADIASRVGIGARTVRRWLAHGTFPEAKRRRRRPSLIDPYEAYVKQRWRAGCHNGLQLHRELTARGYSGSPKALYSFLATLRSPLSPSAPTAPAGHETTPVPATPLENFSSHRATWLFLRPPDELEETEREELALIRQASPNAEIAYHLAQAFMRMMRTRTGHQLDAWLGEAEASRLPEFQSFAKGIQQDQAAVLAGLTLPWSQGPLEGHVNRLSATRSFQNRSNSGGNGVGKFAYDNY